MWIRLTVHLFHGRDRYCFTIKWFSGQSKSLLRFRSMPGEAVNGSEGAIERWKSQVEEFKMSPSYQELLGIDGEAIEFTRIFDIADTSENPVWCARKKHWTWKVHRLDRLHAVQRHRLDKERKWWNLFEVTEGQGLREEILARTLFVSGSWSGKEVVRNSSLHRGQRHRSSSIQEYQCSESWNSGKEEWPRYHTLQRGCFEHRALILNYSFCKSAQYLRSSYELVWTVRLERGRKGTSEAERIRDQRCFWHVWNHKK